MAPVVDGDEVEVDEPGQGVLVHGVNVGEVCDGEEQHRTMGSHGTIPCTGLLYLSLCLISNLEGGDNSETYTCIRDENGRG